jgi:hypothetical protein
MDLDMMAAYCLSCRDDRIGIYSRGYAPTGHRGANLWRVFQMRQVAGSLGCRPRDVENIVVPLVEHLATSRRLHG